jgi:hypothetical protein
VFEQKPKKKKGTAEEDEAAELQAELARAEEALEPQGPRWRKDTGRRKRVYKTVDELRAEQMRAGVATAAAAGAATATAASSAPPQSMKILDMTGPQARVLSSVEEVLQARGTAAEVELIGVSKHLPELQYNVRLLADMSQNSVMNVDRRLRCAIVLLLLLFAALVRLSFRIAVS